MRQDIPRAAWRATVLAALLLVSATACGKKDADEGAAGTAAGTPATPAAGVTVPDVKLGKGVDASHRVTDETDDFDTGDMIYATVMTSGASPSATVHARWTFEDGQLVDSTTQTIAPTGDAATEFHIMKPGGWPKGKYKLTVLVNGTEAKTKEFKVD
jgi:hypothetical protein